MNRHNQRIALHLAGDGGCSYSTWPVTQGIPFADGALARGVPTRVVDENGTPLPTQAQCLATWHKDRKYVKWLLVDFQADLPAGQSRRLFLEYGPEAIAPAHPAPLAIKRESARISVTNDVMQLVFQDGQAPNGRNFFPACALRAAEGWRELFRGNSGPYLYMQDQRSGEYTSGGPGPAHEVVVEEEGPLRACICVRGYHADRQGRKFCPFILRFHVFAGKSDIRLYHTFIFDQDPHAVELAALGIKWPFPPARRLAIGGENNVYQTNHTASLQLRQYDDRCYEVMLGAQSLGRGARSAGWAALQGATGAALVIIRDHWQEYPKGFLLKPDELDIQLWPAGNPATLKFTTPFEEEAVFFNGTRDEERVRQLLAERPTAPLNLKSFNVRTTPDLLWVENMVAKYAAGRAVSYNDTSTGNGRGAAKTTELYLRLAAAPIDDSQAQALACAAQQPLIAPPDPAHTCATRAAGHFYHAGDPQFAEVDAGLDDTLKKSALEPIATGRLYGLLRYGNMVCSHAPGPALAYVYYKDREPEKALRYVGPYNNEADDQIGAVWGHFLRTGRYEHFDLARRYSRNVADVGFIHACPPDPAAVGLMHYHNAHQWSGYGSPSHSLVRGLLLDYYFTGNRRLLEVARENADWAVRAQEPCGIISCRDNPLHREFTGPLWSLLEVYQATWEEKYGELARRSLNWFLRTLPKPGDYPVSVYTRGQQGDEAVVEPPGGCRGHAREIYYLFEAALRLCDSQALREHIIAEANQWVWDELTDGYLTAEAARRKRTPGALFWPVDDQYYWTSQWGCFPLWDSGIVCLAYELTHDLTYAAYAQDQVEGTFLRHSQRIRRFADFSFTQVAFGTFIPRLMRIAAEARRQDAAGLARADAAWRKKRAQAGLPIYTGPGLDLDRDAMDASGNITSRPPLSLPCEGPPRPRAPVASLGRLSTADHPPAGKN